MRSIITSILLLLVLLTAPAAMAYDLEADGIYYNYNRLSCHPHRP